MMEGRVPNVMCAVFFVLAILYQLHHACGNHQSHISKLQSLVKHPVPEPNNLLQIYETELDYGFKPPSIIVLEGLINTKTAIKFKELGVKNDKGIEFKFDSNLDNVMFGSELKNHNSRGSKSRHALVTVQSDNQGIEICLDAQVCRQTVYGNGSINKMEISSFALTNVSYYTETPNNPDIDEYVMDCSNTACDMDKMKKIGKSLVFTRKLPYKKRVHINLEESYKNIHLHMDIRQDQKAVIFNTKSKNKWGRREERQYTSYFVKGNTYTVALHIQTYGVTVSVNGMFFHYYKHRMDPETVKKLWFSWYQQGGNYSFIGEPDFPTTSTTTTTELTTVDTTKVSPFQLDEATQELTMPLANSQIKHYETEVDFNIGKGSKIIMKAIIENGFSIQFRKVDAADEKELKLIFDPQSKTVERKFQSRTEYESGKMNYEMQSGKESSITIQFADEGFQMCIDDSSNCNIYLYTNPGHFFNKINVSDAQVNDIRFYVSEENKPTYIKSSLYCSGNICDIRNVPKTGTTFSFKGRFPSSSICEHSYFNKKDLNIPLWVHIHTSSNTTFEHNDSSVTAPTDQESWFPFIPGGTTTLSYSIGKEGITISSDGVFFHYFKHRISIDPAVEYRYSSWQMIEATYTTRVTN